MLLDSLRHLPAVVFNSRLDIMATNDLGRALCASHFSDLQHPRNAARFLFLDEDRARQFWPQWEKLADDVVAILRVQAGLNPNEPDLIELIGHLSTRSDQFRTRWAANNVRTHRSETKLFRHPLVGELALPTENLHIDSAAGHVLTVFTPQPGSPEHDALQLLSSWDASIAAESQQSPQAAD